MKVSLVASLKAIFAFCVLLPMLPSATAATWYVDAVNGSDAGAGTVDDPFLTLAAGIDAATAGDEVRAAGGVYRGEGNRDLNFEGRDLRLVCGGSPSGSVVELCIIDAEEQGRIMEFHSGETPAAVVDGFVFARGSASPNSNTLRPGGCVLVRRSSPSFTRCTFLQCVGDVGGGIAVLDGDPQIDGCAFIQNVATADGGAAFFLRSAAAVRSCVFVLNGAIGGNVTNVASRTMIRDCWFVGNSALGAGAVANHAGRPQLVDCRFVANTGTIGILWNQDSDASLVQALFWRNVGSVECIANFGGLPRIVNSTLAENEGPGVSNDGQGIQVVNTIVWNNGGGAITGDVDAVTFSIMQGGVPGEGNLDQDPRFADPMLGNFRPAPDSPAIDAGSNSASRRTRVSRDLGGRLRYRDDPGTPDTGEGRAPIVDIGAFEFVPHASPRPAAREAQPPSNPSLFSCHGTLGHRSPTASITSTTWRTPTK